MSFNHKLCCEACLMSCYGFAPKKNQPSKCVQCECDVSLHTRRVLWEPRNLKRAAPAHCEETVGDTNSQRNRNDGDDDGDEEFVIKSEAVGVDDDEFQIARVPRTKHGLPAELSRRRHNSSSNSTAQVATTQELIAKVADEAAKPVKRARHEVGLNRRCSNSSNNSTAAKVATTQELVAEFAAIPAKIEKEILAPLRRVFENRLPQGKDASPEHADPELRSTCDNLFLLAAIGALCAGNVQRREDC